MKKMSAGQLGRPGREDKKRNLCNNPLINVGSPANKPFFDPQLYTISLMSLSTTTFPADFSQSLTETLQLAAQNLAQRLLQLSADPESSLDEIGKVQRALSGLFRTMREDKRPNRPAAPKAAPAPEPAPPQPAAEPAREKPEQPKSSQAPPPTRGLPEPQPGQPESPGSGAPLGAEPASSPSGPSKPKPKRQPAPKPSGAPIPPKVNCRPKNQAKPPRPGKKKPHKRLQRMMKRYRRR
jgi:hypothetical protein